MGLLARFLQHKTAEKHHADADRDSTLRPFRGVSVVADSDDCCQSVQTLADERFLLQDAPRLPLSLCDAEKCRCTYERVDDRRTRLRRDSDVVFDLVGQLRGEESRNSKVPGRRNDDKSYIGL